MFDEVQNNIEKSIEFTIEIGNLMSYLLITRSDSITRWYVFSQTLCTTNLEKINISIILLSIQNLNVTFKIYLDTVYNHTL